MVGLPRKPIKNEICGEEGNSIERRDGEEMKKVSGRDRSTKKKLV
jgi:hypothetical protein